MSYGEYSYYKSQTRMPSYEQYVYDKSVGRPVYNTYGPLQAVTGHYVTAYPRTPSYTVFTSPGISAPVEQMEYYCDVANRVLDIQALGAGDNGASALEDAYQDLQELASESNNPYDFYAGSYDNYGNFTVSGVYAGADLPNVDGGLNLVNAGSGIVRITGDGKMVYGELDSVTADVRAGISKEYTGAQIGGRLVRGEAGLKIPISDTEYLYVGLEGELFAIGAKLYLDFKERKFKIGASALVGEGFVISIIDK